MKYILRGEKDGGIGKVQCCLLLSFDFAAATVITGMEGRSLGAATHDIITNWALHIDY